MEREIECERKQTQGQRESGVWKVSLNTPINTVELRGTERRGPGAGVSEAQV